VRPDIDPNVLGFAAPQGQRRVTDADNKRIPARPGFRNDFDLLPGAEAEFEQTAIQGGQLAFMGAHTDDHPRGTG
jgi:hypothetical protein